jgi:dihydroorotate dehydrogenase (NAD+) catalytic subunit
MGADPRETAGLLDAVRHLTVKPLIVKLTPNCAAPAAVAAAAESHGADAVSLVNTVRGMAMHPRRPGAPWLGGGTGGVSGPAVRAVALAQVAEVSGRVAVPVIGMGGVQSGRQALDLLHAGADMVGVGTESFRDALAGERVARELDELSAKSDRAARGATGDAARMAPSAQKTPAKPELTVKWPPHSSSST